MLHLVESHFCSFRRGRCIILRLILRLILASFDDLLCCELVGRLFAATHVAAVMNQLVDAKDDRERYSDHSKRNPEQEHEDHEDVAQRVRHLVLRLVQK